MSDPRKPSHEGEGPDRTGPERNGPERNESQRSGRDRGADRAILPIILIAAGVLLLLSRMGVFDWSLALGVLELWPLLLIAIGVDILTRGRYRLIVVIAAVAIGALLWRAPGWVPGVAGPAETRSISYALDDASAAEIQLHHGVGRLSLDALPDGDSQVIAGTITTGRGESLDATYDVDGDVAEVEIASRQQRGLSFSADSRRRAWDLDLTREVPIELTIDTGVGESELLLRDVRLSDFDLDAGVGEVRVTLPTEGGYTGEIDAGVGSVHLRIPRSVEVRMQVETGLGGVDVRGTWTRENDRYLSSGWQDAAPSERVELRISGGVGEITVERID